MEFHQQHFSPMDQFLFDPDTNDILGVKANKAGGLDFLPASERDFPRPHGRVFYVDFRTAANGGKGSNANSGRSWRAPVLTMAKVFSSGFLASFDTVVCLGTCTEANLTTPSGIEGVTILGGGKHRSNGFLWKPNSYPALTLNEQGWMLGNFKAEADPGGEFILANQTSGTINGSNFVIDNIEVNGGGIFVRLVGAPDRWKMLRVYAHDMADHVIKCSNVSHSPALGAEIAHCQFMNNSNHVLAPLSDSLVHHNDFHAAGFSKTATVKLDLRGGGNNKVTDNFVGGTFSNAGGYYAGTSANDEWCNNRNNGGFREGRPA